MLPWAGQAKHPFEIYDGRAVKFLCVRFLASSPVFLSLSFLMDGFGHLWGEFYGSSSNVLEGNSICIFPLFHTEE